MGNGKIPERERDGVGAVMRNSATPRQALSRLASPPERFESTNRTISKEQQSWKRE
jgi:hypothetical protein